MLCGRPVSVPAPYKDKVVPCGQCLACRINRRRKWTCRILLESKLTAQSSFVTLTYDDVSVPKKDGQNILVKTDLQFFIRMLRRVEAVGHVRYFACGEYGSKTQRPHYHLVLFGKHATPQMQHIIAKVWGKGFITISELNDKRAAYIAAYTVKKMTAKDARGLNGRPPEFTLQSRKRGIGYQAAITIASMYYKKAGAELLSRYGDVSHVVRIGGKIYPLDEYMLGIMRAELNIPGRRGERMPSSLDEVIPDYEKAAETLKSLEIHQKAKGTL